MKRTVKVRFLDYWADFPQKQEEYLLLRILRKHYDVRICDDPDYVFFSAMGETADLAVLYKLDVVAHSDCSLV